MKTEHKANLLEGGKNDRLTIDARHRFHPNAPLNE